MKKTLALSVAFAGLAAAQYLLPTGTEVLPSADHTIAGQLYVFTADLSGRGFLSTTNGSGFIIQGTNVHNGNILLEPGNTCPAVGSNCGSVVVQASNPGISAGPSPALILRDAVGGIQNGLHVQTSGGTDYIRLNQLWGSPSLGIDTLNMYSLTQSNPDFVILKWTSSKASLTVCPFASTFTCSTGTTLSLGKLQNLVSGAATFLLQGNGGNGDLSLFTSSGAITTEIGTSVMAYNTSGVLVTQMTTNGAAGSLRIFSPNLVGHLTADGNGGDLDVNNSSGSLRVRINVNPSGYGQVLVTDNTGTTTASLNGTGLTLSGSGIGISLNGGSVSVVTPGFYVADGNPGLNCSGTPSASFATHLGIVTHC